MTDVIMALMFTILIEILVLLLLKANNKILLISILANTITNLSLNIILKSITNQTISIIFLVIMEAIIIPLVEALFYFLINKKFKKSLLYSIVANVSSFLFSFVILLIEFIFFKEKEIIYSSSTSYSILGISIVLSIIVMSLIYSISYLIQKRKNKESKNG